MLLWRSDVSKQSPSIPALPGKPTLGPIRAHPFEYGCRMKSCTDCWEPGYRGVVSETPPPPPRTCLPPASRFRLFGPVLASWPPSSRWLGQVRSQDCLSCVLPSICCAVRSTRATFFFYHPNWPLSFPPVPPAATQSLPANRCILGNKPHFTVAEARRGSSAKQPWKAGQAACSRLCQHPPYPPIHSLPFSHPHRRGPFSFSPCATAAPRLFLIHSVFYFPLSATGSPGSPVQPFVRRQTTAADAARSTPTDGSGPPVAACTNRQR